jgi:hypothetical protein
VTRLVRQTLAAGKTPPMATTLPVRPIGGVVGNVPTSVPTARLRSPSLRATVPADSLTSGCFAVRRTLPLVWSLGLLLAGCTPATTPLPTPTTSVPELAEEYAALEPTPDEPPFELEPDFRLLTLADFQSFPAAIETWSMNGDVLVSTGKPRGYAYSTESFGNFTWRFEYRFPRPVTLESDETFKGNTGFLVYITGEPKIWPVCLEVQGKYAEMAAVKENGGAQAPEVDGDPEARLAARKPVGQWNAIEIVSKDGELTVSLNGQQVTHSRGAFLSAGAIGIQAEDHPFEVRRMRIRVDP